MPTGSKHPHTVLLIEVPGPPLTGDQASHRVQHIEHQEVTKEREGENLGLNLSAFDIRGFLGRESLNARV